MTGYRSTVKPTATAAPQRTAAQAYAAKRAAIHDALRRAIAELDGHAPSDRPINWADVGDLNAAARDVGQLLRTIRGEI